jgi:anti-sigma factor RsiW
MKFSGETLMAYADGELDAQTRREIEAALPMQPGLAQQVAQHRALQTSLRAIFVPVLHDVVPQR